MCAMRLRFVDLSSLNTAASISTRAQSYTHMHTHTHRACKNETIFHTFNLASLIFTHMHSPSFRISDGTRAVRQRRHKNRRGMLQKSLHKSTLPFRTATPRVYRSLCHGLLKCVTSDNFVNLPQSQQHESMTTHMNPISVSTVHDPSPIAISISTIYDL